jgi:CheY-like chemotaxis protein
MARVLVCDDARFVVDLLEFILRDDLGHQVWTTTDSTRVLALVRKHQPDVVLLDIVMPGLTGFEVLGQIKRLKVPPAVVLMSALTSSGDVDLGTAVRRMGAQAFLSKPFESADVAKVLQLALAARTAQEGFA